MTLRQSKARQVTSTRLPYVCFHCHANRLNTLARDVHRARRNVSLRQSTRRPLSAQSATRDLQFSTAASQGSPETSASTTPGSSVDDLLHIRKYGRLNASENERRKQSSIRRELKSWSVKNEEEKRAQAPDTIPSTGRILSLPQSYFMAEPEIKDTPEDQLELEQEDHQDWKESEMQEAFWLEPGTLALVYPKGMAKTQLAIYLKSLGYLDLFLLHNGRWIIYELRNKMRLFETNFASQEEVSEILQYVPKRPVERETLPGGSKAVEFMGDIVAEPSHPLVRRMTKLSDEVIAFQRANIDLLDSLYDCHSHKTEFVSSSFNKFVQQVAGRTPPQAAMLAIYYTVMKDPTKIIVSTNGLNCTLNIVFVPKELTRQFETVVGWARQYQEAAAQAAMGNDVSMMLRDNPITSFIEKARRIILSSRKFRSPTTTGVLGPSKHQQFSEDGSIKNKATGEIFSDTDKMIVEFVWNTYCRTPAPIKTTRHHAAASIILRAIGAYPKMILGTYVGELFLQEIGCMPPWGHALFNEIQTPIAGYKGTEELTRMRTAADKLCEGAGFDPQTRKNPLEDSLRDIRIDLGNLEAICIDSIYTIVIDDAISLEPCLERAGCSWIHVHIAHPTAFFDRAHLFAHLARAQVMTSYSGSGVQLMLPHAAGVTMSLAPGAEAMTVSTLLNEDGDVLDIKLRATRINNVIRLQQEAVSVLMGKRQQERAYLIVGADPKYKPEPFETTTSESLEEARKRLPTLQKLDTLLRARILSRRRETPEWMDNWRTDFEKLNRVSQTEVVEPTRLQHSYHYLGDPTIKVSTYRFLHKEKASSESQVEKSDVVVNAMVLACESAGKWCRDRNVPTIYNGNLFHPEYPVSKINKLERREIFRKPRRVDSTKPHYRALTNCQQYIQVTSPLRRFPDMVSQWNINAYLRAEAEERIEPGAPVTEKVQMPWPAEDIEDWLDNESWKASDMLGLDRLATNNYSAQALFRAFHFQEAKLPQVWDVEMRYKMDKRPGDPNADSTGLVGRLMPFLLHAAILKSEEGWENGVGVGQFLPCKLEMVNPIDRLVWMRPVGPASDDYTQKDPIRIWSLEGKPEAQMDVGSGASIATDASNAAASPVS